MGFEPELTTRVTVEVDTSELDNAISIMSSGILSDTGIVDELEKKKEKLESIREPVAQAVAEALSSNQENIISSKHGPPKSSGMMAQSVDIQEDGEDRLVFNSAESVDGFPYPLAIEKGTKDHWVAPVTFKALHWVDKDGEHFSKGHMVSGITPDPFVEPSIKDTLDQIEKIVLDEFDK